VGDDFAQCFVERALEGEDFDFDFGAGLTIERVVI